MLNKTRINLSIDRELLDKAKEKNINISKFLSYKLSEKLNSEKLNNLTNAWLKIVSHCNKCKNPMNIQHSKTIIISNETIQDFYSDGSHKRMVNNGEITAEQKFEPGFMFLCNSCFDKMNREMSGFFNNPKELKKCFIEVPRTQDFVNSQLKEELYQY